MNTLSKQQRLQAIRDINRLHYKHSVWSYFPTPPAVIRQLINHADLSDGLNVLEPSAGKGAIARKIYELWDCTIHCVEKNADFSKLLKLFGYQVIGQDFSLLKPKPLYDRVVANPPFDCQMTHLPLMYQWLKPAGKMVTVANACFLEKNKQRYKAEEFNNHMGAGRLYHQFFKWLDVTNAKVMRLPAGSFATASRTTNVETVLITVTK
ncbi:MAG: hypothetical protein WA885_05220 [Phormidesmis sp.]